MDPPQTFTHGHHVGPTSGVSFLYGQWSKGTSSEPKTTNQSEEASEATIFQAPLISWGDLPQADHNTLSNLPEPAFTAEQILDILDRYFQYISPTYRFLHHPTVKNWALGLVTKEKLTPAQKACVLLVCAQTLLHSPVAPGQIVVGRGDPQLSMACFETAKALLENEPGPPSLASVQARIGMCLYLLSTFRLNECRYCFSFAVTVATALGIHRRQSSSPKFNTLETECRKRTFWSAYVLDGYLSVMLGRPRLLRDEDIDQLFPNNIADSDLMSAEPIEDLPRLGNLEAFISHAKLAKLMARSNDKLYPLHTLTNDQLLQRSNEMLDALSEWQNELPNFLQARKKTFTGQRTFERQNTILKLAWNHVRILATRRCLLMDFSHTDTNPFSQSQDVRAKRSIQECISAIVMVLDTIEVLIEKSQCYGPFWSTQYIALVAISTLYVLMIQGARHALPGDMENFLDVEECFEKARRCHDHLAKLPPSGSQAKRHHILLSHLRSKADKSLSRRRIPRGGPENTKIVHQNNGNHRPHRNAFEDARTAPKSTAVGNFDNGVFSFPQTIQQIGMPESQPPELDQVVSAVDPDGANDISIFGSILTPNSRSDSDFQYMLDFGWESLDTVGAAMNGPEGICGFQGM